MMETITLNEMQRDALQEVANIGASHAATALSQMVNKPIQVGIPRIDVVPIEKVLRLSHKPILWLVCFCKCHKKHHFMSWCYYQRKARFI